MKLFIICMSIVLSTSSNAKVKPDYFYEIDFTLKGGHKCRYSNAKKQLHIRPSSPAYFEMKIPIEIDTSDSAGVDYALGNLAHAILNQETEPRKVLLNGKDKVQEALNALAGKGTNAESSLLDTSKVQSINACLSTGECATVIDVRENGTVADYLRTGTGANTFFRAVLPLCIHNLKAVIPNF